MTWQDYFDACRDNDIWKAFEALAAVGVLPVVNGEDNKGKIKRPLAGKDEAWQHVDTDEWKARLSRFLQSGVPVGIGAKPVGHLVLDIDPKDKSRANLADSWKEASQLIFGADDPPRTLIVATENGAHIWFKVDQAFADACESMGKRKFNLPCGGAVEIFVGMPSGGYQVACAPSEGKTISLAEPPISLPKKAAAKILDLFSPKPEKPKPEITVKAQVDNDLAWITDAIDRGYLDSEVDDYDSWLRVGMALHDKFNDVGVELWESWSNRSGKHITNECYAKVRTFKRTGGNVVKFGSLIAIVERNGGPSPNDRPKPTPKEEAERIQIPQEIHAANVNTIRERMAQREWLWGDKEQNTGWFLQGGLHLVEGKEGTGKSRWILDLCRRWSLDLRWPDGSAIKMDPDSKLLIVASDSHFDQVAMTSDAFGIPSENVIFTGPESDPYNYTSLDDPVTLKLIRHWCTKYKVGMVVIDTLMAASVRPLVDPQEVAQLAQPLRDLARELNIVIVLVGHLNSQGETWGRAMGRQCDNVIRMEACEHDEQRITIRSVKARWNRFDLPTIEGTQSETGWNYNQKEPGQGVVREMLKKEIVGNMVRGFLRLRTRAKTQEIVDHVTTSAGVSHQTVRDVVANLKRAKEIISEGDKPTYYRINPEFNPSGP
jgi:hypothetical protein